MRKALVEKEKLLRRLEKRFGVNEPIFTNEIMAQWSEYSRARVFQLIKILCEDGSLMRKIPGVYYLPKEAFWGGTWSLDTGKIIEKRYLESNGKVIGYYSGLTLMNKVGLSNQVPFTDDIVTMNETTTVRWVNVGKARVILRRARIKINEQNAPVMQVLEIFNRYNGPLAKYQQDNIIGLVGGKIDPKILTECAKRFPKRALENFKRSGAYDLLVKTSENNP